MRIYVWCRLEAKFFWCHCREKEHRIGMYFRVMAPHPTGACALGLIRAKDENLCMVYAGDQVLLVPL